MSKSYGVTVVINVEAYSDDEALELATRLVELGEQYAQDNEPAVWAALSSYEAIDVEEV